MSGPRVVYLERSDAGARLTRVRVVGLSGEDAWAGDPMTSAAEGVRAAGAWLADTLPDRRIDVLCVDTAGAVAAWVDAPEGDPANARTLVTQSLEGLGAGPHAGDEDDDAPGGAGHDDIARFPGIAGESGVEALPALDHESDRLGVLVTPDPAVRLLLDQLDQRRVSVGRVCSLWHLLAWAWRTPDRNGSWNARNGDGGDTDRVVSEAHPATAMVIGDPAGRLVWAWSVDGKLVASGGHRLAGARDHATIRATDVPRLVHDWLSWSSQTGLVPDRIRLVADFSNGTRDAADHPGVETTQDEAGPGTTDLASPADPVASSGQGSVAGALSSRWPDAALDVVDLADPVGETLVRAARHADQATLPAAAPGAGASSTTALGSLSQRRGRAHRAMYRWGGLTLVGLALVLLVAAWGVRQDGEAARERAGLYVAERQGVLDRLNARGDLGVVLNLREFPDQAIQNAINAMSQQAPPATVRPILRELENMSLVIGDNDVVLYELSYNDAGIIQLSLATPDTESIEQRFQGLRTIDTTIEWTNRVFVREVTIDGETWQRWNFTGRWRDRAPAGTPAGNGAGAEGDA